MDLGEVVAVVAQRMTAREQLLAAREAGHELVLEERVNEDHPEAPSKTWVVCTCGYRSTAKRSRAAVNSAMAWHLGKVIADVREQEAAARTNGVTPINGVVRRAASAGP